MVKAFQENAARRSEAAYPQLVSRAAELGYTQPEVDRVLDFFRNEAQMNVYFFPDQRLADGTMVVERLRQDGRLKNQFETGQTNGNMDAGRRDEKERVLFNGLYHANGLIAGRAAPLRRAERRGRGGPRRSGVLRQRAPGARSNVNVRTSVTHKNSKGVPFQDLGTFDNLAHVLLNLAAPGDKERSRVSYFKNIFNAVLGRQPTGENPRRYLEGQIHGPVEFRPDPASSARTSWRSTPRTSSAELQRKRGCARSPTTTASRCAGSTKASSTTPEVRGSSPDQPVRQRRKLRPLRDDVRQLSPTRARRSGVRRI